MRGVCSDGVLPVHDSTIRDLLARRLEQAGFEAWRAELRNLRLGETPA
jgi:hypothetical protein